MGPDQYAMVPSSSFFRTTAREVIGSALKRNEVTMNRVMLQAFQPRTTHLNALFRLAQEDFFVVP